jgi:hypothetical protein
MEYDIEEAFRLDPGETDLSEELQAEIALEQQLAAQADIDAQVEEAALTGVTQQPQQITPSTEGEQKDQQWPWERGYDFGDYLRNTAESALAAPTSLLDFGVEAINKLTGQKFAKPNKFENDVAQSVREISSVVLPTVAATRLGMRGGLAAQSRVGWSIGNTPFMKFIGSRGVEAAASVTVGAVSSQYEDDNIAGRLKQKWPNTYDWIPDSYATLKDDAPDVKRNKNIYEDLGMGTLIDMGQGVVKFAGALANGVANSLRKSNRLVGETAEASKWLETNSPKPSSVDPEEAVVESALKREEALDEDWLLQPCLMNPDLDQRLKGVHDMFDYTELGVRTVDDFGVVGAAIDQARIAKNLDTSYGRIG